MFADAKQQTTQIHDASAVKQQGGDRHTASRGEANHDQQISAPGKVVAPAVAAWVVQRDDQPAHRVICLGVIVLMVVAALAGQREVLERSGSPP